MWSLVKADMNGLETVWFNTLTPRQNGRHFSNDIFKRILFDETIWISVKMWLKLVSEGQINNTLALVQTMAGLQAII